MTDQAIRLGHLATAPTVEPDLPTRPVFVVASGKGGVGKSVIASMMAEALADSGPRVLLVDGAQNLGHLHVILGVSAKARLEEVQRGEIEPAALVTRVTDRLWLLASDSGAEGLYALPAIDQARLHHRLAAIYDDFDIVVVDAGAGIETVVRLATMGGTRLVLVTVPEVAALTDAYALVKLVHAQLPQLPIDVVVNRAGDPAEGAKAFDRLAVAAERFLGRRLTSLGVILEAPALRGVMRRPGGLLADPGLEDLKHDVRTMANTLAGAASPAPLSAGGPQ